MKIPFIFLLLSISFNLSTATLTCLQYFQKLIKDSQSKEDPTKLGPQEQLLLLLTGKNVNDLGYYQECQKHDSQRFILAISDADYLPSDTFVGICGPKQCKASDYNFVIKSPMTLINNFLENFNRSIPMQAPAQFLDPEDIQQDPSFGYLIIMGIVISFGAMIVLGTIFGGTKSGYDPYSQGRQSGLLEDSSAYSSIGDNQNGKVIDANEEEEEPEYQQSAMKKFLRCFSFNRNLGYLWSKSISRYHDSHLQPLLGFRTVMLFWILITQTFLYSAKYIKNYPVRNQIINQSSFLFVLGGQWAIDALFFLGGFLAAISIATRLQSVEFNRRSYCAILSHRFIRLWPLYIISLLIYWKLSIYFSSGPLWPLYAKNIEGCDSRWFTNIMMLGNIFLDEGEVDCMEWSWYVAVDLQLFIIAPLLVNSYLKDRHNGRNSLFLAIFIGTVFRAVAVLSVDGEFQLNGDMTASELTMLFRNPLARLPIYAWGLRVGLAYKDHREEDESAFFRILRNKEKIRKILITVGFFLLFLIVWTPSSLQNEGEWGPFSDMMFLVFAPFIFVLGVNFLVGSFIVTPEGPFAKFFSTYFLKVCSRIQYSAYLLMGMMVLIHVMNQDAGIALSMEGTGVDALGNIIVIFVAAGIFFLVFERPLKNLEELILPGLVVSQNLYDSRDRKENVKEFDMSVRSTNYVQEGEL